MGDVGHESILAGFPLQGGVIPKVEMAKLACADHLVLDIQKGKS